MKRVHQTHGEWRSRRSVVGGFTLVEMLTVMAVITILLVIGLPGWTGMNSTGVRRSAVSKMMGVFDQARAIAITEGKNTYVAFAAPVPQLDPAKWGRSCVIYVEDSNFVLTQRTPWIFLPVGMSYKVSAVDGINGDPLKSIMNYPDGVPSAPQVSFPVTPVSTGGATSVKLPYLKFDGTGSTDVDQNYARLWMFQGMVTGDGTEVATKRVSGTGADARQAVLDEISINPATGRAKYIVNASNNLATPTPSPATPTPTPTP